VYQDATILITTRNRRADLCRAIESALSQIGTAEVLVIDDGSSDGTAESVRASYPSVRLYHFEHSKGCIIRRNEGALLAGKEVVVSIDDDAVFSSNRIVAQTLAAFSNPHIGAVAIPYLEPHKDNILMQKAPDQRRTWITDRFVGTAHAVRKDIFLALGGYRQHLVHQGEEGDFCLRMLQRGAYVRLGNSDAIVHYESPKRSYRRMDFYGRRNDILFAWHNVPLGALPAHLLGSTAKGLLWSLRLKRPLIAIWGLINGYAACARNLRQRQPVSQSTYRLFRLLRKQGPLPIEELPSPDGGKPKLCA
jgi:glycosyltransferase involved in cell wall biosynthesis